VNCSDLSTRRAGKVNLGNALVPDLPPSATVPTPDRRISVNDNRAPENVSTGQVQIAANIPVLIVPARASRAAVKITNLGATDIFLGHSIRLTLVNGDLFPGGRGGAVIVPTQSALYAIATAATSVSWMEFFD
jgi:hypothetical protein